MKACFTAVLALSVLILAAHQVSAIERGARAAKIGPVIETPQKETSPSKPDAAVHRASAGSSASGPSQADESGEAQSGSQGASAAENAEPAATPPPTWSDEEIREAKAHCEKVLRGVEAVIEAADPIKEGECGAPAPVRLVSIGRNPEVAFAPPATVTCDMVASLAKWIKDDLQPLAKEHLDGPIVKIGTMSSYSCRNAYGRKTTRLSEHALANAVDIGSFTTESGLEIHLLTGWGLTARDVEAIVARAKAEQEAKRAAASASPNSADNSASKSAPKNEGGQPADVRAASAIPLPVRKAAAVTPASSVRREGKDRKVPGKMLEEAAVLQTASHLGGPENTSDVEVVDAQPDDRAARFLRAIHSAACRHFGTVLGPEVNDAHRNHFHFDMAKRRNSNYCE